MAESLIDESWIWNPEWNDTPSTSTAGGFVDVRKTLSLSAVPSNPIQIRISADTRYKLWINSQFVHTGPVKGDAQQWFYDELDIQPYIQTGESRIAVRVMRLFPGTHHGIAFVRMPVAGLYIVVPPHAGSEQVMEMKTDET
ncbi:hypothetical protein LTR93_012054 [Exophiala xenobiotica]|nr:hypothetical protein LTR93_012054 [Exophiala xenobiotica]